MAFVELRAHSAFSFGDGAVGPESLVRKAAGLGYSALGLTDHADLGGIIRFGLACQEHGIQPIVGAELVVDGRPLALLARSETGFRNLAGLITRSRVGHLRRWTKRSATRGRPRLAWADLAERSTGLFLLTGPPSGSVATALRGRRMDEADELLDRYRATFGDQLAIEVQHHFAGRNDEALSGALVGLAERRRIPWIVAQNPRYVDDGTRLVHEILTALRQETDVPTALRRGLLHPNGEWRLAPAETVSNRWRAAAAGIETTAAIAEQCRFQLRWVRPPLPKFAVPAGHTDLSFLRYLVLEGAKQRWTTPSDKQLAQLEHEVAVIGRLGYAGFFLVMWDAVRYAREHGILAQGRGSAANSAVAYCLGITAVDPVKHGLLFERFLSEARIDGLTEAPDIDVDFEHDRREEVLDYVYRRFRRSHSALTGVTQLYSACTAIQDAMRAFGQPAELAFRLSKRLHGYGCEQGAAILAEGLAQDQGLDVQAEPGRTVLEAVRAFDDMPRLRSTHPGGFVLSSQPLGDYLPIESTSMGRTIIQFDKDDLDAAGIPKFDFLGLGGLAVVRRAFDVIKARTGTELSMYGLPDDDPATYAMISRGETIGTFQIESRAQIASILHTKPERLYDIVVQVALIRPGPIQAKFVHPYTKRRRGEEPVTYLHPALEPILARTQGIPIFQEQAMAIAMVLAGYSAGEADLLRRTMGHQRKRTRLLGALGELRERLIGKGIDESIATRIEEDLMSFANYGFPESHAWSFALIAYATAYLKAHHPTEFAMAILNAQPMGFYPVATLVHDAKRSGVQVVGPCLVQGSADCTVEDAPARPGASLGSRLRIGWRFIRGMGDKGLEALTQSRKHGPFTSIGDAVRRARLGRADATALARAGAFSYWEPDRRRAAWEALRHVGDTLPLAPSRASIHRPRLLAKTETVFLDYFSTGMSLTGHPMEHLRSRLLRAGAISSRELVSTRHGERVIIAGLVVARQRPESANGVMFVLLEDESGFLNVIVRREVQNDFYEVARHALFMLVLGTIQRDGDVIQVLAERLKSIRPRAALTFKSRDFR